MTDAMVKIAVSIPHDIAVKLTQTARRQKVTNGEALARTLSWAMREPVKTDADRAFSIFIESLQDDPQRRTRLLYERMRTPSWVAGRRKYDQKTEECLAVIASGRKTS